MITLRLGNRGRSVRILQQRLNQRLLPSPGLNEDGIFGPLTREAVLQFQQQNQLRPVDGVVGRRTWAALLGPFEIDFMIQGADQVPRLTQPSNMTCWAALGTMLMAWRTGNRSLTMTQAMAQADQNANVSPTYSDRLRQDLGLDPEETGPFATACGLRSSGLQNFSVSSWMAMLRAHGPIGVVTREPSGIHGRVILGMTVLGNGHPEETFFHVIDPARGDEYDDDLPTFAHRFERVRMDWRQVWYNP